MSNLDLVKMWRKSPTAWVESMFGLVPQPLKEGYVIGNNTNLEEISARWFRPFEKGKHITWQQWVIFLAVERGVQGGKRLISVASGHGVGKLNPLDMRLDTPDGSRIWGELKVGDKLFGVDGKPTEIIEQKFLKEVPMYRVTFDDRSYCDVSSGHLWDVRGRQERRNKKEGWRTMETIDILEKGVKRPNGVAKARQWEIPVQGRVEFKSCSTALAPYLAGVWLGDGSKGRPFYTKPYLEIKEKIESLGYAVHTVKNGKGQRLQGVARLFKSGVFLKGSPERFIPDEYKYNSIEARMALFEGLCDSDGEVNHSGSIGYSTTSKQLAEDVIWLARSLGCKATLQPRKKKGWYYKEDGTKQHCKDCFRVSINAPFNPFTIKHRKDKYKPSEKRYLARWIDSIVPLPSADGMCVTVDNPDGLYLANDFIVTHNSSTMALLLLWFLTCYKDCQIPCTAPTRKQMYDVLWKEVAIWHRKLPPDIKAAIEVEASYIRIKESPKTWYARAATAKKEAPEALAGIHADDIFLMVDEASAVPDEVFETGEGAMTNKNAFVLLISNYTRLSGYFHNTQRNTSGIWQTLRFSSADSPIVEKNYIEQKKAAGEDTTEYRVRVQGLPPKEEETVGEWSPLLSRDDLRFTGMPDLIQPIILGIDPSGKGRDKTAFVLRDPFKAIPAGTYRRLKNREIVERACDLIERYKVLPENTILDTFGVGADVLLEFMKMKRFVQGVLVGQDATEKWRFTNLKAEMYWRMRNWLVAGGQLLSPNEQWDELLRVMYSTESSKIKIMGKRTMRSMGIASPDKIEALMLTFYKEEYDLPQEKDLSITEDPWDYYAGL